jgi:hypothetical protein
VKLASIGTNRAASERTARYYGVAVIALAALALSGLIKSWPSRAAENNAVPAQGIR